MQIPVFFQDVAECITGMLHTLHSSKHLDQIPSHFLAFSIFLYWQIKLSSCSEDNKFPFLPLQKFHITKSACFPHCFIRTWNRWCQPWKFPEVSILFDICLSIWRKIIHNYELFVLNSSSKYTLTDSHSNLSAVCKPSIFQHAHKICIVSPH